MAKETIEFNPGTAPGTYEAEINLEGPARLHLEGEGGVITILQKDEDGTNYDPCHVYPNKSTLDTSIADPNDCYPVDIKIVCTFKPSQAFYRTKE